jgi:hypothetical protein
LPSGLRSEETLRYIEDAAGLLRHLFREVIQEWPVSRRSRDALQRDIYCPRIDIVAGPFNIDTHIENNVVEIQHAYENRRQFFAALRENGIDLNPYLDADTIANPNVSINENARCLLAIEVEHASPSEKHRLGSIVNAASIGFVGVVVGWDDQETRSIARIQSYLDFLSVHKKITGRFHDAIIIERARFIELLEEARTNLGDNARDSS